jgi:hypothetical protein
MIIRRLAFRFCPALRFSQKQSGLRSDALGGLWLRANCYVLFRLLAGQLPCGASPLLYNDPKQLPPLLASRVGPFAAVFSRTAMALGGIFALNNDGFLYSWR